MLARHPQRLREPRSRPAASPVWRGHMSAEMSARHVHLYPNTRQIAPDSVLDWEVRRGQLRFDWWAIEWRVTRSDGAKAIGTAHRSEKTNGPRPRSGCYQAETLPMHQQVHRMPAPSVHTPATSVCSVVRVAKFKIHRSAGPKFVSRPFGPITEVCGSPAFSLELGTSHAYDHVLSIAPLRPDETSSAR